MLSLNYMFVFAVVMCQKVEAALPPAYVDFLLTWDEFDTNWEGETLIGITNIDYRAQYTGWGDIGKIRISFTKVDSGDYVVKWSTKTGFGCKHGTWNMTRHSDDTHAVLTKTSYNDGGVKKVSDSAFYGTRPTDYVINIVCNDRNHEGTEECPDGFVVVFVKENTFDKYKDGKLDYDRAILMEDIQTDITVIIPGVKVKMIEWSWIGEECKF